MNEINKAAQSAVKALEICQKEEYQRMINVENQIKWCSYYMYGVNLNEVGSNPADPRNLMKEPIKNQCGEVNQMLCTTYDKFASMYHPEMYFLYLKPSDGNKYILNVTDITGCLEIIHNYYSINSNSNNINEHEVDCLIAALQYFGKYDYFIKYLSDMNLGNILNKINKLYIPNGDRYTSMANTKPHLIEALGGITPTYFKILGGMYYKQLSYIPNELQKEYDNLKKEYENNLAAIMKLIEGVNSLQLCWAEANNQNNTIKNNKDSAVGINATAVANCISGAAVDGFLNGAELDEVQIKTIQVAIENLEKRNKERDAELKEQIMLEQIQSKKMNIIISVIGIILFIFILILYFFLNKKINQTNNSTMMTKTNR